MKKYSYHITVAGILLLVIFLRFFHISTLPLGMHIDEAGLGLNAWSLANYGTDRYGNFMPVCPSNFYGEQSAFYTYFCALLVKLRGLNMNTLRLPGVIMGLLSVWFGALLIKEKWGKRGFLTGLILMGIFPYFIMNSRFALDCNAMLGALTVSLYALVRLLKKAEHHPGQRLYGHFALTGILFGITLYTYIVAALVISVFCILFGLYYLFYQKDGRSLRFRQLLFLALPLCIMAVPLILVVCVNYFDLEPVVTPFFSIPKMAENRTAEVSLSLSAIAGKLKNLIYPLTSDGKYGSSDRYWTMYPWSVGFVAVGAVCSLQRAWKSFRSNTLSTDFLILSLSFAEVLMFLLCGYYNYHINGIFIALAWFCVNGIFFFGKLIRKPSLRTVYAGILIALYGTSFAGFIREYYFSDTSVAFQLYNGVYEAVSLLTPDQRTQEIYVLDEVGEFYFLSAPLPPKVFAANCNELGYVQDYENLHFREPAQYEEDYIYICNKHSGWYGNLSGKDFSGYSCNVKETGHYYIIWFTPTDSTGRSLVPFR